MYIRRPPPPTHPYFPIGVGMVLTGFLLLALGLETLAQCASGSFITCSVYVYVTTRVLGTGLIFVGFILMLLVRKPVTPLAVLLPRA